MPKGGARMGSGPPPDPNALRRDRPTDRNGWTMLPTSRSGPAPAWPLESTNLREADVWAAIWSAPQAVAWETLGWTHDVALYVRWLVMAEAGDMKAASESRQWSDRLGLNPAAMLRNRWKISADEVGEKRADKAAPARSTSSRSRLKVVPNGDATA